MIYIAPFIANDGDNQSISISAPLPFDTRQSQTSQNQKSLIVFLKMSESLLPTLDASLFLHGTDEQRKEFSSKLVFEMLDHACVKLVNHGIEDHVVEELFGWVSE